MSDSYLIATGGRAPEDFEENAKFHAELVSLLAAEVRHQKWPGAVFRDYARTNGLVAIQVAPGVGELTIEGLRQFREYRRREDAKKN